MASIMIGARSLRNGTTRAFIILFVMLLGLLVCGMLGLISIGPATGFSILQNFATLGPVALGLGLTMLVREFDISISGMFGLGGCIAVLVGALYPALGIVAAVMFGLIAGAAQGGLMMWLRLGSVPVTLGGLLTFNGIANVLTGSESLRFTNNKIVSLINEPLLGFLSLRSLAAVLVFAVATLIIGWTRLGRDMIALGSSRQAAVSAGVSETPIIVGVFATSGALSALAGAMLSYSLSAASPSGLSDVAVPAVAGVILGGASLLGGAGRPAGTAAGVLILCVLATGLTALGVSSAIRDFITGGILLAVAISDGPDLGRRIYELKAIRRRIGGGAGSLRPLEQSVARTTKQL
jgi:ribose/xylose/arabinose/galactoside ABC-type transport system permease subunit